MSTNERYRNLNLDLQNDALYLQGQYTMVPHHIAGHLRSLAAFLFIYI